MGKETEVRSFVLVAISASVREKSYNQPLLCDESSLFNRNRGRLNAQEVGVCAGITDRI